MEFEPPQNNVQPEFTAPAPGSEGGSFQNSGPRVVARSLTPKQAREIWKEGIKDYFQARYLDGLDIITGETIVYRKK